MSKCKNKKDERMLGFVLQLQSLVLRQCANPAIYYV